MRVRGFSMPPHCIIVLWVRTMQIDGINVVYFQFMHLLSRPCYVGDVYLYLCIERSKVRVTVCVLVFVVCVVCGKMMMKEREKVKPGAGTQPTPVNKLQGGHQA